MYTHANTPIEPFIFDNISNTSESNISAFDNDLRVSASDSDAYGLDVSESELYDQKDDSEDSDMIPPPQRVRREPPLAFINTWWGRDYASNPNWTAENLTSENPPPGAGFYQGSRFRPEPQKPQSRLVRSRRIHHVDKDVKPEVLSSPNNPGAVHYKRDVGSEGSSQFSSSPQSQLPEIWSDPPTSTSFTTTPVTMGSYEDGVGLIDPDYPSCSQQTPTSLPRDPVSSSDTPAPAATHTLRQVQNDKSRHQYSTMSAWVPFSHTIRGNHSVIFRNTQEEQSESRDRQKEFAELQSRALLTDQDGAEMGPWSSLLMCWDDYDQWRLRPSSFGL